MLIYKKATFLPFILLAIGTFTFGQKQKTDSFTTVVREMANSNIYEVSYTVGYAGTISKQYQRF